MKTKTMKTKTRHFGGKIGNFADKFERAFETKHLKAYLRGAKRFIAGHYTNGITGQRETYWATVKEVWA